MALARADDREHARHIAAEARIAAAEPSDPAGRLPIVVDPTPDHRKTGVLSSVAMALAFLGDYEQAVAVADETTSVSSRTVVLANAAAPMVAAGDRERFMDVIAAIPQERRPVVLIQVAQWLDTTGKREQARYVASETVAAARVIADQVQRAKILAMVLEMLAAVGDNEQADRVAAEAVEAVRAILDPQDRFSMFASLAGKCAVSGLAIRGRPLVAEGLVSGPWTTMLVGLGQIELETLLIIADERQARVRSGPPRLA